MPDPAQTNMTGPEAQRADQADPSRRGLQLTQRHRAIRGDFTDSQPLALAASELDLSTNPTTTDTVTIGGEVYEFVTAAGAVAADVNIAVQIGGSAAVSFANFLAAVNGTAAAAHASITNVATTAPALGRGTKPVFAEDLTSEVVGLWYTGTQGVSPELLTQAQMAVFPAAYPSFALSDGLTAVVAWTVLNFNLFPTANPVSAVHGSIGLRLAVVTALLDVPFKVKFAGGSNVVGVVVSPKSATGLALYWDAATYLVAAGVLTIDLDTGGAVDPANGQFLDIICFGQFTGLQV